MYDDNIDLSYEGIYVWYNVPQAISTSTTIVSGEVSPVTTISVDTGGPITGPTVALTGGVSGFTFSGGAATITLVSPLTAKGQLYGHDGTSGGAFPTSGSSDGDVLTRDSASTFGIKWSAGATSTLNVVTIDSTDSPYSLTDTNDVVLVDVTGGDVTILLHNPTTAKQKYYDVKLIIAGNDMILDGNGSTIDDAATLSTNVQYTSYTILPDNTNGEWWIV